MNEDTVDRPLGWAAEPPVHEPAPDLTGWSITEPEAAKALARMSDLFRAEDLFFDRQLRPITWLELEYLRANPGYTIIRQAYVVDRLPPYVALKVSTVWIGENLAPPGAAPAVFETMTFAASPSTEDTQLDEVVCHSSSESQARQVHGDMVEAIAALMGDPRIVPVRRRGKRADAKLWTGMSSRMRHEARTFKPESDGSRRVRGRGGKPDRTVTWTWRSEAGLYQVEHRIDPVLRPVSSPLRSTGRGRHRR